MPSRPKILTNEPAIRSVYLLRRCEGLYATDISEVKESCGQSCVACAKVHTLMARTKSTKAAKSDANADRILIKRYGNRRLYNTETSSYVNYQELIKLIRDGHDVKVIDSRTKADVTKAVLMQVILEEEKNQSVLPVSFLFQLIRARESAVQDFFKNYLSSSFEAYLKTKEEFDRRFRGFLQMSSTSPQLWEKLVPGADAIKEFWGMKKEDEEEK